MFHLKRTIYVIFAFIVIHLVMYMFEIDIFEFFDKRVSSRSSSNQVAVSESSNTAPTSTVPSAVPSAVPIEVSNSETNIDTNIQELEKSLEELKDITKI